MITIAPNSMRASGAKDPSTKRSEAQGPHGFSLPPADAPGNRGAPQATRPAKGAGRKPKGAVMGNRTVITTAERKIGLYLHWNGGRDTVEPLLRYCELIPSI